MPRRATRENRPKIRVECFLLCDHVRVENGKLDILGGGWNRITPRHLPLPYGFHIALKLAVPAAHAGAPLPLRLAVTDEAGEEIGTTAVEIGVDFDGTSGDGTGSFLPLTLPLGVELTLVRPGVFVLTLTVDGETIAETSLTVAEPVSLVEATAPGT